MSDDIKNAIRLAKESNKKPDVGSDAYWKERDAIYALPAWRRMDADDPSRYISPEEYHKGNIGRKEYVLSHGGAVRNGYALGGEPTALDGNKAYIDSLYQNILGRAADTAGEQYWTGQLGSGDVSQGDVLSNFAQSPEFQNLYAANPNKAINALYQESFGRAPDQAGLDFWMQQAKGGLDLGAMTKNFLGSQEGQNVSDINQLYQQYTGNVATPEQIQAAQQAIGPNQDWSSFLEKTFPIQDDSGNYQVAGGWQSKATPVPTSSADLMAKLGPIEQKYGLPQGYLMGMMGVESTYGANQQRPGSTFGGAFQLSQALRDKYGVSNAYDWEQNADAAAQFAVANRDAFKRIVGRDPTREELYGLHQQGQGGYSALANRPDMNAARALMAGGAYGSLGRAVNAIRQNLPSDMRGRAGSMTSQDFMDYYKNKFINQLAGPDQAGQQAIADYYAANPGVQLASGLQNQQTQAFDPLTLAGAGGNVIQQPIGGGLGPWPFNSATTAGAGTPISGIPGAGTLYQPQPFGDAYYTNALNQAYLAGSMVGTGLPTWDYSTGLTVNSPAFVGSTPGLSGYNPAPVGITGGVSFGPGFSSGGAVEDAIRTARASGGGAWTRKEGKNPEGGLNEKGRASLRAQGHDIKRPQPEGGPRKDSFCARMSGMAKKFPDAAADPNSRLRKSLRVWKCN